MSLYHLIYQSQALTAFSTADLAELLQKSHAYNMAHGLTGMLLHAPNGQFLQVLEGDAEAVQFLYYHRIANDPRHEHLIVLSEGPSATQVFPNWTMSFRDGAGLTALPGYLAPRAAYVQVCKLSRATPELMRLLLDFTAGYDDSRLSESMIGNRN
jgi:Sensors of blue-light using FAD